MKRMTEKAIEMPGSFTPGIAHPMVYMHTVSLHRDERRHGSLTLLGWALPKKNLVAALGTGDTGSVRLG